MELKECITCGSHSFTGNKCDYCGNQYEVTELHATDEMEEEIDYTEITFDHGNKRGDKILTFMFYLLLSIIWFAVTIFIPPLFLITIAVLIILAIRKIIKKLKLNS